MEKKFTFKGLLKKDTEKYRVVKICCRDATGYAQRFTLEGVLNTLDEALSLLHYLQSTNNPLDYMLVPAHNEGLSPAETANMFRSYLNIRPR